MTVDAEEARGGGEEVVGEVGSCSRATEGGRERGGERERLTFFDFFLRKGWFLLIQKYYNQAPNRVPLKENKITYTSITGASSALCRRRPSLP